VDRIHQEILEKEITERLISRYGCDPRIFDKSKLCGLCKWSYYTQRKVSRGGHVEEDVKCIHPSSSEMWINVVSGKVVCTANSCYTERQWNAGTSDACHPFGQNWEPGTNNYKIVNILDEDQEPKFMATLELHKRLEGDREVEDVKTCRGCKYGIPGKKYVVCTSWDMDDMMCSHPSFRLTYMSRVTGLLDKGMPLCRNLRHVVFGSDERCGYDGNGWVPR